MRGSIVRLIAGRETRDLLRDRRTVLLILLLPILLFPLFGLAALVFAKSLTEQTSRIGIVGLEFLPKGGSTPLLDGNQFDSTLLKPDAREDLAKFEIIPLEDAEAGLNARQVDVALIVPPDFCKLLEDKDPPTITVLDRDGDEKSKLAARRLNLVLLAWAAKLREAKFEKAGLPRDFDRVFILKDPQSGKPPDKKAADELRDTFVKAFPFILMMWVVAGAIQPAVDLTAGEKERGTMETLLISPASRGEIVVGKFLAVFAFSYASVIWNVIWLCVSAIGLEIVLGNRIVNPFGLLGCLALGVPLAMLFSAAGLAFGVFARSTKEGQYYLMPLLLVTMPLAMWSMMPGNELTTGSALVPVTGAMLLQQKFLNVSTDPLPWEMLVPVLGGLVLSIAFALWLAVVQFHRESVLFRNSDAPRRRSIFRLRGGRE